MVMLLEGRHLQFFAHKKLDPSKTWEQVGETPFSFKMFQWCFLVVSAIYLDTQYFFKSISIGNIYKSYLIKFQ